METKRLKVVYHPDKDILSLIIPPRRPSRTSLTEASLTEVLEWAYHHYVLRYVPAFAAAEKSPTAAR